MKHLSKGSGAVGSRVLAMLLLMLGAASVAAGNGAAGTPNPYVRAAWQGYASGYPMYPTYFHPGACLSYGACADAWWGDRRPARRPMAPGEPPAIEQDIWGTTGSPWGYVRRIPPPTPQSQIQPRYQDASTVRPEFGGP